MMLKNVLFSSNVLSCVVSWSERCMYNTSLTWTCASTIMVCDIKNIHMSHMSNFKTGTCRLTTYRTHLAMLFLYTLDLIISKCGVMTVNPNKNWCRSAGINIQAAFMESKYPAPPGHSAVQHTELHQRLWRKWTYIIVTYCITYILLLIYCHMLNDKYHLSLH